MTTLNMTTITYAVTITGKMPLLMHRDNIEWSDQMEAWRNNASNKKGSKAGDDRSPAFRWLGCLYHDDEHVWIPSENIARCLMEGGAMVPVPGGKNGKTFKSQTQSGMMCAEPGWRLQVGGKYISHDSLFSLESQPNFAEHIAEAKKQGFTLFVKRAKIGTQKHVRVRPRFDDWSASGSIVVMDEQITIEVLAEVLEYAGRYKGLGDWRPGGKTPGPYGTFTATVKPMKPMKPI